jgi:hypothetical protein
VVLDDFAPRPEDAEETLKSLHDEPGASE